MCMALMNAIFACFSGDISVLKLVLTFPYYSFLKIWVSYMIEIFDLSISKMWKTSIKRYDMYDTKRGKWYIHRNASVTDDVSTASKLLHWHDISKEIIVIVLSLFAFAFWVPLYSFRVLWCSFWLSADNKILFLLSYLYIYKQIIENGRFKY